MKRWGNRIAWILVLMSLVLLCQSVALGTTESAAKGPDSLSLFYQNQNVYPGQRQKPEVFFSPASAVTPLKWSVSNPEVAEVDPADGTLTALQPGTVTVTVSATNGIETHIDLTVSPLTPKLSFEPLEDGSGCRITGCTNPRIAYTINIPAEWNGLPVKEIAGDAFKDCENLRAFTADSDQATFYAVDGVLFADDPVKTLVRFPNCSAFPCGLYEVPADTKAIGPCAFAGLRALEKLYLPEGLTDMGDCAFMEVWTQVFVYVPDSLVNIGSNLMMNQMSNVPFYGHWETAIANYAMENAIPFGGVFDYEAPPQTVELTRMKLGENEADPSEIPEEAVRDYPMDSVWVDYDLGGVFCVNLTEMQANATTPIRINAGAVINQYLPDTTGYSTLPTMEGLYGVGQTEQETILAGYDQRGQLVGSQKVNGDFTFGLEGATQLTVIGGKGTKMSLCGFEPMVIPEAGELPLDQNPGVPQPDGSRIQYYALTFPEATLSYHFPDYMNIFVNGMYYADGSYETASTYAILTVRLHDPMKLDKLNQISMNFDTMVTLVEYEDFVCEAKASYHLDAAYGERMYEIWQAVKQVMIGTHYPEDGPVHKLTVSVNGQYPMSSQCIIDLDDLCVDFSESNVLAYAHEMTHALDQSICNWTDTIAQAVPQTWMEGRAEIISRQVLDLLGVEYSPFYGEDMSWDFLSQEEKDDFARVWVNAENREMIYTVGYNFYRYLLDHFDNTFGAAVMKKMMEIPMTYSWETAQRMICDVIRKETCETVFEDFARDVIKK